MKKFTLEFFLLLLLVQFAGVDLQAQCSLACNDNVQVSVAPTDAANPGNCEGAVNLDMITEGADDAYLFGAAGPCMAVEARLEIRDGSTLVSSGLVTNVDEQVPFDGSPHLGGTLITKVTLLDASGFAINSCWGSILVEDKAGPVLTCPTGSGPNGEFVVTCADDLTDTGLVPEPTIVDNCDTNPTFFLVNETSTGGPCAVVTTTRTYSGVDASGNGSIGNCSVVIQINPISIIFPEDIVWECAQNASFPSITDPAPLNSGVNVANACDITSSSVLGNTGSGVPNVYGLNNDVCKFNVTHSDQLLNACTGAGTANTFKIIK